MSRADVIDLVVAIVAASIIALGASRACAQGYEDDVIPEAAVESYYEDYVPPVPPAVGGAWACDTSGAAGQVKGGGVSISIVTYPCEVARTFETIDELEKRGGFWRSFAKHALRARLVTRGIFSVVFGLFGLG